MSNSTASHSTAAESRDRRWPITRVAVVFEAGLALLAIGLGFLLGFSPLRALEAAFASAEVFVRDVLVGVAATAPLLLALALILRSPLPPLRRFNSLVRRQVMPLFRGTNLWQIAAISVAAGVGEELLFRGLAQAAIAEAIGGHRGWWVGLLIASVLFGMAHWISHTYAVLAGLVGAYLGALFVATEGLLAPIVTHALYDFVALAYLVRRQAQRDALRAKNRQAAAPAQEELTDAAAQ